MSDQDAKFAGTPFVSDEQVRYVDGYRNGYEMGAIAELRRLYMVVLAVRSLSDPSVVDRGRTLTVYAANQKEAKEAAVKYAVRPAGFGPDEYAVRVTDVFRLREVQGE